MITSLDIRGFRCFEHLRVPGLTRVNLLVGKNNSGKTTVLEAVELLHLGPRALARGPIRRREEILPDPSAPADVPAEIDAAHLFYGHECRVGAEFSIEDASPHGHLVCAVVRDEDPDQVPGDWGRSLRVLHGVMQPTLVRLSPAGGIDDNWRRVAFAMRDTLPDLQFVAPGNADIQVLARLWEDVALTPAEALVYDALHVVAAELDRIAFLGSTRRGGTNVFVKLVSTDRRLPLGNLGAGVQCLLDLALHLLASRGGVLLVDEIDTGLHYSVMKKMWRLLIETAQRLDVQVFATTHSEDCVRALAEAVEQDDAPADEVSLHRIDPGEIETMRYSAADLSIATQRHIEVR